MMNDYSYSEEGKKLLSLLKYTRQWKQNVGVAIFFYVLGVLFIIMGGFNTFIGGLYMMIGGSMLMQGYEQIFFTSYMNTSAKHRFYSVNLYALFSAVTFTIGYILAFICFLVKEILLNIEWNENIEEWIMDWDTGMKSGTILIFVGIIGMVLEIYYGVVSKAYISSILTFIVIFFAIYMIMINTSYGEEINSAPLSLGMKWQQLDISIGKGFVIGYVFVIAGIIIEWLLRRAMYNKQYSSIYKRAFLRFSK